METPASERMPAFSFVRGLLGVGLACRRSRCRDQLSSCESPEQPVRSAPSAASVEHQLAALTMSLERAGMLGATRSTLNGARLGNKGGDPHTYCGHWRPRQANSPSVAKAPSRDRFRLRVALCGPRRKSPCMPFGSQFCRKFAADTVILAPPNKKPPSLLTRVCHWPTCHRSSYSGCAATIFTLLHPAASRAAAAVGACRS